MKTFAKSALAAVLAVSVVPAFAGEAPFSRAYSVETSPAGRFEVEQTVRHRTGRAAGSYSALDFATEVSYGFTEHFEGAFYLKYGRLDARGVADDEQTPGGMTRRLTALHGAAAEFIAAVLDPDRDPFGLAFYYEPEFSLHERDDGASIREFENEYRLMVQKDFLQDRLMLLYNLVLAPGFKKTAGETAWKGSLEFANELGVSFRFVPGWSAGWEFRNLNELEGFDRHEKSVYWTGPALNYNAGRAWFTLGLLGKAHAVPSAAGEKWETTLKFGFPF